MQTCQISLGEARFDSATLAPLRALEPELILVFGSLALLGQDAFVDTLRAGLPGCLLIGCSTAGEIDHTGVHEHRCILTGVRFEGDVRLRSAEARAPEMTDSRRAGAELGMALASPELRAVLVFGKGVNVNGSALIEGLSAEIGAGIPITGGLAGDDGAFTGTLTLTAHGAEPDAFVALGLYGDDLLLGHGSYGGWSAFGPARKVTRSAGNILYELDGEAALNIYKRYLGDHARDLPASGLLFPFEMLDQDRSSIGLIRTILGIDEAAGSLTLAGDIDPAGYLRLMHASTDDLVAGAEEAARQAAAELPKTRPAGLAILVSCVGRRLVMGDQVDDEVAAVAHALGKTDTLAGFYSYGEIAPFSTRTDCKLHNQTMTVTFIGER